MERPQRPVLLRSIVNRLSVSHLKLHSRRLHPQWHQSLSCCRRHPRQVQSQRFRSFGHVSIFQTGEVVDRSTSEPFAKGVFSQARRACREFLKSPPHKPKHRLNIACRVGVFEKAIKVFTAIAACVIPVSPQVNQEFLLDTGTGRNLSSSKTMPVEFQDFITDAPEEIQFSTGGWEEA